VGIDGALRKAVFLDRDGVINRAVVCDGRPYPPQTLAEVEILPGVEAAIFALKQAGFFIVVVTNQPDVARGKQTLETVESIHGHLGARLAIDDFRTCHHDDRDNCACRKPKPGLLRDAAADWGLDMGRSFLVGDRWRDIAAGQAAGCRTIWIDCGYAEQLPEGYDYRAKSLLDASTWIAAQVQTGLGMPPSQERPR
jgi:D-glycero-D-manno-heptose 1,7-bisphosphate phosphatase